jgi:hypothetical protein
MNNDKKMDVVDWRATPRPVLSTTRAPRRFFSPTVIGGVGTLLIHALILPTTYFGIYGTKVPPREIQQPGAFANSRADAAESLVLITLPTIANSNVESIQNTSSLPAVSKLTPVSPVNPDPPAYLNLEVLTLDEEPASKSTVDRGGRAEQARLFGIYTGQIQARINRIWRRPRTPVNEGDNPEAPTADESFQCQAQIVQDAKGNVQEILMLRCNGSPAWQRSLVIAIQQASPLPAPPSASVFSHSVTLNFVGLSYVLGSPDDDYDIAPAKVAQMNDGSLPPADPLNPPQSNRFLGAPNSTGTRN